MRVPLNVPSSSSSASPLAAGQSCQPSKGFLNAVKRQERLLRSQLQLQQGEGSEEEESEEEEAEKGAGWGARKGAYYEHGEVLLL